MPDFIDLAKYVVEFFDPADDSDIMAAFQPWLDNPSGPNVPLDQIFNLLHQEFGRDEVNSLVSDRLRVPADVSEVGHEHNLIKRISSDQSGVPQVVTTNFDLLFELGVPQEQVKYHVPLTFPDIAFGTSIAGITYLHGRLADAGGVHHPYVLSSADFGRAYLSEAWATNFIRHLLGRYTVVLVGYQAEDPPIKYLLQGLNHDGNFDRTNLYTFDRGSQLEIEAKWLDRGVTAISYNEHHELWRTLEGWADRADDPRRWRASIISASRRDPKEMAPHERGQVAHVLRTVQGAKLFAESEPLSHPEWVCVMDANVRSAKMSSGYGEGAETFDPLIAFGLDDEMEYNLEAGRQQLSNFDNLLVWRAGDDNPHEFHRIGERQVDGYEATPIRLGHLIAWIGKSIESPVLAWWAIRQNGLHPRLLRFIDVRMSHSKGMHQKARHVWNLILEIHRDHRNRFWDSGWFDLKKRIADEGWTASVIREFRCVTAPRVDMQRPLGLAASKPPDANWNNTTLHDLGRFKVLIAEHWNNDLEIPDSKIPEIFGIIGVHFDTASGLLSDLEVEYFSTPTCYPDRENDGNKGLNDAPKIFILFIQMLDRMAEKWPKLLHAFVMSWREPDKFFYRKLKFYALSKAEVFGEDEVINAINSYSREAFWDPTIARELLFLLVDRWSEISSIGRNQLIDRILDGPEQLSHQSIDDYNQFRKKYAARYARYLVLNGCSISEEHDCRLNKIIEGLSHWSDGLAESVVAVRGMRSGWVNTDETPDEILDLPVNMVLARAKDDLKRDFGSFIDKRPFTGLVKTNPRKALSALTIAARGGEYHRAFWVAIINNMPEDIPSRLKCVFLHRLARLPNDVIVQIQHEIGSWLRQNFAAVIEFDASLGWLLYDHIIDGILSGGAKSTKSSLGDIKHGGELVEKSRRTLQHAINGSVGKCALALMAAVPQGINTEDALIPEAFKSRIMRLIAAPGEGADHAVSIFMENLNWFLFVDPIWSDEHLIPMLAFDHQCSESAWNGFLHHNEVPISPLAKRIKPLLIRLFPWIENFSWDRELSVVASQWLGWMRLFMPDQPDGLTEREMRRALRSMSEETRSRFIFWLGRVGQGNDNGWNEYVIPFVNNVWPRDRKYRTSTATRAWVQILENTGNDFSNVFCSLKRFMTPLETNDPLLYRFTDGFGDEEPITKIHPKTTLDLMNTITPLTLTKPSFELSKVLTLIAEIDPKLTTDPRYMRLIDLVERS